VLKSSGGESRSCKNNKRRPIRIREQIIKARLGVVDLADKRR